MKNLLLILALFIVGFISVDDLFAELSSENIQTYEWKSLKGRDLNTFRYKDDFFTLDTTKGKSKVYFKIDRENYIVSLKTKHPIKIQQLETRNVDWFLNPVYAKKGENLKKDFCTALLFTSTKIEPKRKLELEKFPFSKKQRYIYYHESNEVDYICFKPGERDPSGHFNASKNRELYISYSSRFITPGTPAQMIVLADVINFLLIDDGDAVLRYTT